MATPLATALADLHRTVGELTERHRRMEADIARLQARNEELEQELADTRQALRRADLDVEYLTMSHRLADNPDTLIATRRHIARLIRTVDLCIDMLKE